MDQAADVPVGGALAIVQNDVLIALVLLLRGVTQALRASPTARHRRVFVQLGAARLLIYLDLIQVYRKLTITLPHHIAPIMLGVHAAIVVVVVATLVLVDHVFVEAALAEVLGPEQGGRCRATAESAVVLELGVVGVAVVLFWAIV